MCGVSEKSDERIDTLYESCSLQICTSIGPVCFPYQTYELDMIERHLSGIYGTVGPV